jgi:hypothetical protein
MSDLEAIAVALGLNIEKEGSNHLIKDSTGIAFEAIKISNVRAFLFRHVRTVAKATGHRVNAGAKMHQLAGVKIHRRCWQ